MSSEINIAISNALPARDTATSSVKRNEPTGNVLGTGKGSEQTPQQNEQTQTNATELESLVSEINKFVQNERRELQFSLDEELGDTVITVIDKTNDEVIRKIPSDKMLAIRKNIETSLGLMFNEKS